MPGPFSLRAPSVIALLWTRFDEQPDLTPPVGLQQDGGAERIQYVTILGPLRIVQHEYSPRTQQHPAGLHAKPPGPSVNQHEVEARAERGGKIDVVGEQRPIDLGARIPAAAFGVQQRSTRHRDRGRKVVQLEA